MSELLTLINNRFSSILSTLNDITSNMKILKILIDDYSDILDSNKIEERNKKIDDLLKIFEIINTDIDNIFILGKLRDNLNIVKIDDLNTNFNDKTNLSIFDVCYYYELPINETEIETKETVIFDSSKYFEREKKKLKITEFSIGDIINYKLSKDNFNYKFLRLVVNVVYLNYDYVRTIFEYYNRE